MAARIMKRPDALIFAVTMAILAIGIVMVFSASYTTANLERGDAFYFIKRQIAWAAIGLCFMLFAMRMDYRFWRPLAWPGFLLSLVLLAAVLMVGDEAMGAQRRLVFGPIGVQPSEIAKLAMVNFLAAYLTAKRHEIGKFTTGFLFPLATVLLITLLVILEPDLGTSIAIMGIAMLMFFAAGTPMRYLLLLASGAIPAVLVLIKVAPYRLRRLTAFINPWQDPLDSGWNIIQSLLAVGSGGLFGLGLGESRQKFHYLPEQHTDFIFAVLAEELGFIGGFFLILLFLTLAWRGYRAALRAPDLYGCLLASGITTMIVLQAALNIAVVIALGRP